MDRADREARPGARVALATGLGEVGDVNHRFWIAGRQDAVHAMATGAVGDGLCSCLRCQAVKRGIEADHPVLREPEFSGQAQIAVATSTGLPDMSAMHRRRGIGVLDDAMLAMTVGAQGRLGNAPRERLSVDTAAILLDDLG